MTKQKYQLCTRCVMDTTDPNITFDMNGRCNHCRNAIIKLNNSPFPLNPEDKKRALNDLLADVKKTSAGKKYDCIIGVSGGVDSTYAAYKIRELGLKPLAVHLDNGWNSELAVKNIENICRILNIDLYTHVIDWEEFKDIQLSFLKSSTPDSEIPTDHAIRALWYKAAVKEKVKYLFPGNNIATESILPSAWSQGHADWHYIKSVQEQFGTKNIRTFPYMSYYTVQYYNEIKKIKWVNFLDYIDYNKDQAKMIITEKFGWKDYGGKHYESLYTKIFQAYILPTKFGYDKRRAHLSSLIVSGQMTREMALEELQKEIYPKSELEEDIKYLINKFDITKKEFQRIMELPPKTRFDYPNNSNSFGKKVINNIVIKLHSVRKLISR